MAVLGFEGTLTVNGVNPGFRNLRFGYSHTEVDVTTNLDKGNRDYTHNGNPLVFTAFQNLHPLRGA